MKKTLLFVILALTAQIIKAQVPSYVATNGLIGYWPFNGNANDESGNGKNGVKFQVSGTTDRFGNLNSAYSFDGISSYIEVTNSAGFDLGGNDFTISVWVNSQSNIVSQGTHLISKSVNALVLGTYDNGSSGLPNTNAKYGVGFDTYGKNYGIYPDILPKTGWNHIVCVKSSSGYDYFINNQKYTLPFNLNNVSKSDINSALFFGKKNGAYAGSNFSGYLDDIAIYNRALTQQEITNLEQADAFITTWVTTTGFETITLSAQPDAPNYTIDWGDGFTNTYTATQAAYHIYNNSGEHTVSFTGTFPHLMFSWQTKLKAVQQWGTQKWTSMANMFQYCTSLNSFPNQAPDLSLCTNMSNMFYNATAFNHPIGSWDVSSVTDMSFMFQGATAFNQPIGSWDVSMVRDMFGMFYNSPSFNQPIDSWDVSNVTKMGCMFLDAITFNQPLGSWNVSKVTSVRSMFNGVKLSTINYDNLLQGWAARATKGGLLKGMGMNFSGGSSNYCNASGARDYLINTYGWTITDGGLNCADLGTEEFDKSSLNLYPNPTSSVLNIKADATITNQPYTISDALGKIVLKGKLNEGETNINVEHLSKGIYCIKIANDKANKFIKE